jgi:hypothetical protein
MHDPEKGVIKPVKDGKTKAKEEEDERFVNAFVQKNVCRHELWYSLLL